MWPAALMPLLTVYVAHFANSLPHPALEVASRAIACFLCVCGFLQSGSAHIVTFLLPALPSPLLLPLLLLLLLLLLLTCSLLPTVLGHQLMLLSALSGMRGSCQG
jgi:hypothetical protein